MVVGPQVVVAERLDGPGALDDHWPGIRGQEEDADSHVHLDTTSCRQPGPVGDRRMGGCPPYACPGQPPPTTRSRCRSTKTTRTASIARCTGGKSGWATASSECVWYSRRAARA